MRRGLVHIYTGEGKGKTTAAVGLAVRAAGQGLRVLFVQFFKEDDASSGEKDILRTRFPEIELVRSNCRHPFFTGKRAGDAEAEEAVRRTFEGTRRAVEAGGIDMVVLDEAMAAVNGGWLAVEEVVEFIESRPPDLEVVLTGRNAPVELVRAADYVTEMLKIKHPFDEGVKARKGIEF
ncbi:MAG TPA: cob(I)yrinic acid a,c-diamide adenosyltransferase [Deltaproteobacteria bacterium]|nr:cob(I)yrinic acid a,c-diamide adenosyltransferase [Deltaproteobacteria bacterium]